MGSESSVLLRIGEDDVSDLSLTVDGSRSHQCSAADAQETAGLRLVGYTCSRPERMMLPAYTYALLTTKPRMGVQRPAAPTCCLRDGLRNTYLQMPVTPQQHSMPCRMREQGLRDMQTCTCIESMKISSEAARPWRVARECRGKSGLSTFLGPRCPRNAPSAVRRDWA